MKRLLPLLMLVLAACAVVDPGPRIPAPVTGTFSGVVTVSTLNGPETYTLTMALTETNDAIGGAADLVGEGKSYSGSAAGRREHNTIRINLAYQGLAIPTITGQYQNNGDSIVFQGLSGGGLTIPSFSVQRRR